MKYISTNQAPKAIGPYSQAVHAGAFVFCSGQIGLDPITGDMVAGEVEEQTERAMLNLKAILECAGLGLQDIVKTEVYLTNIADDFAGMNRVYAELFKEHAPARATVGVAQLPRNALVEISCVAFDQTRV